MNKLKTMNNKRASYRMGVEWIALNDYPNDLDRETIAGYVSTCLLADLFGKTPDQVATNIIRFRQRMLRGR